MKVKIMRVLKEQSIGVTEVFLAGSSNILYGLTLKEGVSLHRGRHLMCLCLEFQDIC